jgi:D-arabinose 1-dehydrogenase-like Zn-dependent alcohol dehydrogenase
MRTQPANTGPAPVAAAGSMEAIVQDLYGSADRLRLAQIERPVIAAGEVLVRVRAAGVYRGTCHLMRGEPYMIRILGFGFRGPKSRVPGLDVAGTVAAAGADVTRFQVGDEVFGIARGSFAEYAAAREDKRVRKPAALSFEQAAVVAVSGLAAIKGLHTGRIAAGQKVLIIGASGGVGTYAVQLAKAFGAKVTGVASTAKAGLVRATSARLTSKRCVSKSRPVTSLPSWARRIRWPRCLRPYATWKVATHKERSPSRSEAHRAWAIGLLALGQPHHVRDTTGRPSNRGR